MSSPSSRWATANTRCSGSRSAASMARSVCGRAAVMGRLIPGNRTALRIGTIGRFFAMVDRGAHPGGEVQPGRKTRSRATCCYAWRVSAYRDADSELHRRITDAERAVVERDHVRGLATALAADIARTEATVKELEAVAQK